MGQGKPHEQVLHMSCFSHRRLQKLSSGRHIIEKLPHQECRSVGRACLFKGYFLSALDDISCPEFLVLGFGDQFCSRHGRNTGKRFAAETKGRNMGQIFHTLYLARRVT